MNHDEQYFEKKIRKFSLAKQCPRCKQLTLTYKSNAIFCTNCSYEEKLPLI